MTKDQIRQLIREFGGAAGRAAEAGFDVVELQFGLGYLVHQFLSPRFNRRTDAYGGRKENRLRFGLEVLEEVRKTLGDRVPVIARISATTTGDPSEVDEAVRLSRALEAAGVSALHVASGSACDSPPFYYQHMRLPGTQNLGWAARIRRNVSVPVIAAGRLGDPGTIRLAVGGGLVDAVALGRPLVADPDLPDKMCNGNDELIYRCGACLQGCLVGVKSGGGLACIVNPETGREGELTRRAERPARVAVVGGGPAGMQAAITARRRGHHVSLFNDGGLGGQFNLAVLPPGKEEMKKPLRSMIHRIRNSDIELHLDGPVTAEDIFAADPEHVIVATGSVPAGVDIDGLDGVLSAGDVLRGKETVGESVLVIGGGMVGLETAEYLAVRGHLVTVVEILDQVAGDMEPVTGKLLLKNLETYGVRIRTGTQLTRFDNRTAYARDPDGERALGDFETVVAAVGSVPADTIGRQLADRGVDVRRAGDARRPGNILSAVTDGFEIARDL